MPTCQVTVILWNVFGMGIVGFVLCCYSMKRFHSCLYIAFLYLHICKRICNVLVCFLLQDDVTYPDHVALVTSYLVKFLFQICAGFWAISTLKIDFLFFFRLLKSLHCKSFFRSLCLAKEFSNFHCIFDKVKRFVCFFLWIAVFWFQ